jgi:hypothetical protein
MRMTRGRKSERVPRRRRRSEGGTVEWISGRSRKAAPFSWKESAQHERVDLRRGAIAALEAGDPWSNVSMNFDGRSRG